MIAESPTPHLPRGAGGPPRRAAGRVSAQPPAALVLEPDPLARLLVVSAAATLGFRVAEGASACVAGLAPSVVFVSLARADDCRRVCAEARRAPQGGRPPLVVGYGACAAGLLAAHRAHRCADVVLRLTAAAGLPRFAHLPAADLVAAAGLTQREADVLVLLLRGFTTAAVGARLCVSPSTARTHCRAVLRKLGAGDRRMLRALLLSPSPSSAGPGPEVCLGDTANFAEESAVARLAREPRLQHRSWTTVPDGPRPFASTAARGERMGRASIRRCRDSRRSLKRCRAASSPR